MYPNLDFQNFYETTLSNDLAIGATDVFLTVVPTPTEGFLTIDPEGANPEIIWYSSKTSSKVVCPAGGRGFDGTTAQAWTSGTKVIMAPVAETQRQIIDAASTLTSTVTQGWIPLSQTVGAVTYNGNRSYDLTMSADVSATLSPGMRVRTTRTVAAPVTTFYFDGTNDYFNRASASVTGMTFTNNFTVSAWINVLGYQQGSIISRFDGTSGFTFRIESTGQLSLAGFNGGAGNYRWGQTYQSIPLNKWTHVAATWSSGTILLYIDGISVPLSTTTVGTAPTTIAQAGNLQLGATNAAAFFSGRIGHAAVFSAVLSAATIRSYISQSLAGTEANLVSAYTGANTTDLNTTNANALTATGGALSGLGYSPFGNNAVSTTLDYGIITSVATTTVVVQVPEGCTIPTSGGVSAMSYSTQKAPYGMPINSDKWTIYYTHRASRSTGGSNGLWYNLETVTIPVGSWNVTGTFQDYAGWTATGNYTFLNRTLSSATNSVAWSFTGQQPVATRTGVQVGNQEVQASSSIKGTIETTSQVSLYGIIMTENAGGTLTLYSVKPVIFVELSYL